ncbi:Holliday junction branch migration protein RuvA [candidate division KSB1 bacterium]|nr:Holliday junction branch migration protein RuvA [candidate division KSB1 bacterium]
MIAQLRGLLIEKSPTSVVLETGGVGFQVGIPLSSLNALGELGEEIQLYTYLHVREDTLQLYGFATKRERRLFLLLISVSGVGPKLAQSILSGITVDEFEHAVHGNQPAVLNRVPGVGKKTAERLILELQDKIKIDSMSKSRMSANPALTQEGEEAILALVSLGYKRTAAELAVQKALSENSSLNVEALLRTALSEMR